MQSRTILVLRLIQDKGGSKALPLFITIRGIRNKFLVLLPSWHDELRVCKEKTNKITLFQNVIRLKKTSNSETVLWVYYTIPFGFSLLRQFWDYNFQLLNLSRLAKDH